MYKREILSNAITTISKISFGLDYTESPCSAPMRIRTGKCNFIIFILRAYFTIKIAYYIYYIVFIRHSRNINYYYNITNKYIIYLEFQFVSK